MKTKKAHEIIAGFIYRGDGLFEATPHRRAQARAKLAQHSALSARVDELERQIKQLLAQGGGDVPGTKKKDK